MLNPTVARQMLPLVNDPASMDLLKVYVEYRMQFLRGELETATDMNKILRIQGKIEELKRVFSLREEVNKDSRLDG